MLPSVAAGWSPSVMSSSSSPSNCLLDEGQVGLISRIGAIVGWGWIALLAIRLIGVSRHMLAQCDKYVSPGQAIYFGSRTTLLVLGELLYIVRVSQTTFDCLIRSLAVSYVGLLTLHFLRVKFAGYRTITMWVHKGFFINSEWLYVRLGWKDV